MRASLTFEEKITAAYLHYAREVEQQTIAMAMGVNMGRVNEACMAVKAALEAKAPYIAQLRTKNENSA